MKPSFLPSLSIVLIIVLTSSFTIEPTNGLTFNIKIQGLENRNVSKDGVIPSELAQMIIEANDENIKIEEFEIVLARGNRPVSIPNKIVQGNNYDLTKFSELARSGDRIVIKVNEVTGSKDSELSDKNELLIIPIK